MADANPKDSAPKDPEPPKLANDAGPGPAAPASPPVPPPPTPSPAPDASSALPPPVAVTSPSPAPAPTAKEPAPATANPGFNAKAILAEGKEQSAFPRVWKDSGFEKFLRLIGQGDIVDAMRQRKDKAHHISQAVTSKIGFGDIYRAARGPAPRLRNTGKAIGAKIADMMAGRLVSGSIKLVAITFVAGMIGGVSGWSSIALLGLATGASSAIYNYGKGYFTDLMATPKGERGKVKFFTRQRALDGLKAFGSGFFNGAFGAWLANLPLFQKVMKHLHNAVHQGIGQIQGSLGVDPAAQKPSSFFSRQISKHFHAAAHRAPQGVATAPVPSSTPHPALQHN